MTESPVKYPHVGADYFRERFLQHGNEGHQLDAMAAHCSYLFNRMKDEEALHLASLRSIVQGLSDASPLTALALSLAETINEMEA